MAIHSMTCDDIKAFGVHEHDYQRAVLAISETRDHGLDVQLEAAVATIDSLDAALGPLLAELVGGDDPVWLLWQRLFVGREAIYLRLVKAIRLIDGDCRGADLMRFAINGGTDYDRGRLVARQVGRAAAFTAQWQYTCPVDAEQLARTWATERYQLGAGQELIARNLASDIHAELRDSVPGQEPAAYPHRLAAHHRLRILFVDYAGLALTAHLAGGALSRLDHAGLREGLRQMLPEPAKLRKHEYRYKIYRWLARQILDAYKDDPDQVFIENAAIVRTDPLRATIADTISGPFFTTEGRLARDQSNLHWSRNGLGREEENSFFHTDFTQGIFHCAKVMLDDLARQLAAAIEALGQTPLYLYDGACGSAAVARNVIGLLQVSAPHLASEVRWQLTDVSAASLTAAWEASAEYPQISVHQADLSAPLISAADHGTFDIAGQNLGAHHLPDEQYASMIRGLVALTRPGGLIYLGDVDVRMGIQVLNGLWANLYAVEWPRMSRDPYQMFQRPSTIAVSAQPFDFRQLSERYSLPAPADVEAHYKLMVPLAHLARTYPPGVEFYSQGFGYVTLVTRAQLHQIDLKATQGKDWRGIIGEPDSLSAELTRLHQVFSDQWSKHLARSS